MAATKQRETDINIMELSQSVITVPILGTTPFICNSMPFKAMQYLLNPPRRLTGSQRESKLKHDPMAEFRDSFYAADDPGSPTLIQHMATAWKKGMGVAALRIPGATKTEISQLLWVDGPYVDLYGIPEMHMGVVRSADMAKTPDIRTRAILPEWCCWITIRFITPMLSDRAVVNLLSAAGLMSGVGDWRQEKGSGNFGAYRLVEPNDPDHMRIRETMGRENQIAAVENTKFYDSKTERLYTWYVGDVAARGQTRIQEPSADELDDFVHTNGIAELVEA